MQTELQCEGYKKRSLVIDCDPATGLILKSFDCVCGHTTEVKAWPPAAGEYPQDLEGHKALGKARNV